MSYKIIASEIKRFLNSFEPEVMVIRGDWGVGKTYAWRQLLQEAKIEKKIQLKAYTFDFLKEIPLAKTASSELSALKSR